MDEGARRPVHHACHADRLLVGALRRSDRERHRGTVVQFRLDSGQRTPQRAISSRQQPAYCRTNGAVAVASSGAPAADGDYTYPWLPPSSTPDAKYFYPRNVTNVSGVAPYPNDNLLWCDATSPSWPRLGPRRSPKLAMGIRTTPRRVVKFYSSTSPRAALRRRVQRSSPRPVKIRKRRLATTSIGCRPVKIRRRKLAMASRRN